VSGTVCAGAAFVPTHRSPMSCEVTGAPGRTRNLRHRLRRAVRLVHCVFLVRPSASELGFRPGSTPSSAR
jgi:hypothetical protein